MYTYDPSVIGFSGKDRMRFELGDTEVKLGGVTAALSDEEYDAVIHEEADSKRGWKQAKLRLLHAILMKMAYAVDTRVDILEYDFSDRMKYWQKLYDDLKEELEASGGVPKLKSDLCNEMYFFAGMQSNLRARGG
jgi:hypothetical protein